MSWEETEQQRNARIIRESKLVGGRLVPRDDGPAPRDVRPTLNEQEARLIRVLAAEKINALEALRARGEVIPDDQRGNLRRAKRVCERMDEALIEAGHE